MRRSKSNYSIKGQTVETLDDAIELIKVNEAEKANREIHEFEHKGNALMVLNGRYGPYISFKKKNFKIPKDTDPKALTLEKCLEIIESAPKKTTRRKKK